MNRHFFQFIRTRDGLLWLGPRCQYQFTIKISLIGRQSISTIYPLIFPYQSSLLFHFRFHSSTSARTFQPLQTCIDVQYPSLLLKDSSCILHPVSIPSLLALTLRLWTAHSTRKMQSSDQTSHLGVYEGGGMPRQGDT